MGEGLTKEKAVGVGVCRSMCVLKYMPNLPDIQAKTA